ncbi:MAG TPA: hypothetical protein VFY65_03925 [Longimicrobium sp.]|nr:hypothetical protein [Longimicrobium sp.]
MTTRTLRRSLGGLVPLVLVLAAACTDNPVGPGLTPEPQTLATIECRVSIPAQSMACSYPEEVLAGSAIRTARLMGGQDRFVKLTNFNNTFENDVFQTTVTVQNLLAAPLGTPDGSTVTGVMVFFAEDPSNEVTVANPSGFDMFTAPNQPYFLYNQILTTYQVSEPMNWQFSVPVGVLSFSFKVYVYASQADESGNGLEAVWTGGTSSDWFTAANWNPAAVPGASTVVQVPSGVGNMPVLTADATAEALRVNSGATLGLGGFNIEVGGNVDGSGAISGGTVTMSGTGSLLKGTLPTLFVTGSTALQGATLATGPVAVTGSLTVADSALSISIP